MGVDPWIATGAIGALGGAAGAIAAAIVASVQIGRLAANERSRATIEYMRAFDTVQKQTPAGGMETTAIAMSKVRELLHSSRAIGAFKRFSSKFPEARASGADLSQELIADAQQFKKYSSSVVSAVNYFALAAALSKAKKIDTDLFVKYMSSPLNTIRAAMTTLAETDPVIAKQLADEEMQILFRTAERLVGPFDPKPELETHDHLVRANSTPCADPPAASDT